MSDVLEIEGEVIVIHPDAKYVLVVPDDSSCDLGDLSIQLDDWWNGDSPVLLVSGMRLVRVDKESE